MKFVIKSGSTVKLYSGEMNFEALAQFLKENFLTVWNLNNLIYTDKDGDKINITTQDDLEVLKEIVGDSPYTKLEIENNENVEKLLEQTKIQLQQPKLEVKQKLIQEMIPVPQSIINIQQKIIEVNPQPIQIDSKVEESQNQKISKPKKEKKIRQNSIENEQKKQKREKKEKKELQKEIKNQEKKERKDKEKQLKIQEKKNKCKDKKQKLSKIQEIITEKIVKIVDERIKTYIPCIKNQLSQDFEPFVFNQNKEIIHDGILCNGCNSMPIQGIRYKCLQCPEFNLCSNCELKIQHQHNLLKMKKNQEQKKDDQKRCRFKFGKQFMRNLKSSSSSDETNEKSKIHWRRKHHFDPEIKKQCRFNKRLHKLQMIFGQRDDYEEFIERTCGLKGWQLIDLYAIQHQIDLNQVQEKRNQFKKSKLSAFYDCPEQEFDQIVKNNPKRNFREIIQLLKSNGERNHNGQNFRRMRNKMRDAFCKKQNDEEANHLEEEKVEIHEIQKIEQVKVQPKIKPNVQQQVQIQFLPQPQLKIQQKIQIKVEEKINQNEITKLKGQTLLTMKEWFGEENVILYVKFIEGNINLGKEGIIQEWINKNCI